MDKRTSQDFDNLFRDNYKGLVSISYRYTKRRAIAEEVVQDVFVDFWNRIQNNESILNYKAYLSRATVYRSLDTIKKEKRYTVAEEEKLEGLINSAAKEGSEPISFSESKRIKLKKAVAELPDRTREVFMLSKYENYTHNEISENLEISKKTVEYHITKALLILRKALISLVLAFCYIF